MDECAQKLDIARKKIYVAEYMFSNTYAAIKEPKMLLTILENVYLAYISALEALLAHERSLKLIPRHPEAIDAKIDIYKEKVQNKYKLDVSYLKILEELKALMDSRKKAPVEFQRKESYVVAETFENMKKVDQKEAQKYLKSCKGFVNLVEKQVKKPGKDTLAVEEVDIDKKRKFDGLKKIFGK